MNSIIDQQNQDRNRLKEITPDMLELLKEMAEALNATINDGLPTILSNTTAGKVNSALEKYNKLFSE